MREVGAALAAAGIRHGSISSDKIGYKVREHSLAKVPLILAVGRREAEQRTVSVRRPRRGERQETALGQAVALLLTRCARPTSPEGTASGRLAATGGGGEHRRLCNMRRVSRPEWQEVAKTIESIKT